MFNLAKFDEKIFEIKGINSYGVHSSIKGRFLIEIEVVHCLSIDSFDEIISFFTSIFEKDKYKIDVYFSTEKLFFSIEKRGDDD